LYLKKVTLQSKEPGPSLQAVRTKLKKIYSPLPCQCGHTIIFLLNVRILKSPTTLLSANRLQWTLLSSSLIAEVFYVQILKFVFSYEAHVALAMALVLSNKHVSCGRSVFQ